MLVAVFFFFQAEDGIRDLVRSRGLGDVYKRQDIAHGPVAEDDQPHERHADRPQQRAQREHVGQVAVSYTHLTLPTSDLV